MKQLKLISIAILALFAVTACGNDYLVRTTDGQIMEAEDKPEIDEETGMMEYEDATDRDRQIPQDEVKEIIER